MYIHDPPLPTRGQAEAGHSPQSGGWLQMLTYTGQYRGRDLAEGQSLGSMSLLITAFTVSPPHPRNLCVTLGNFLIYI